VNPSYFRLELPLDQALDRVREWTQGSAAPGPVPVESSGAALELALEPGGSWRAGKALFVYARGGWTVFEDLSGGFSFLRPSDWLGLAGQDHLVFASYNDAIPCAELFVIRGGQVLRALQDDASDPSFEKVDMGAGGDETPDPPATWIDVAGFVDEDEHLGYGSGLFWLL
jgi:hypothetical protein